MKVKIKNWDNFVNSKTYHEPNKVWFSPEHQYIVLEIWKYELYVFGEVIEETEETTVINYIDSVSGRFIDDESDIKKMDVEWTSYGFCKLNCIEIDLCKTKTKRFYYDIDLYKRKYKELHGVPYHGNKTFKNNYQP